jgi:hypothetical protein
VVAVVAVAPQEHLEHAQVAMADQELSLPDTQALHKKHLVAL